MWKNLQEHFWRFYLEIYLKSAGLELMIERLKGQKLFGYIKLLKTERSETARLADLLDD